MAFVTERLNRNKNVSKVVMTMSQSSGSWLNGAMMPQQHYVSMMIKDPEGKKVVTMNLTFEQVTRMLMYNGEVECTLSSYRSMTGEIIKEEVEQPQTIHSRMKERLGESRKNIKARIDDLYKDVYAAVNAGTAGKKKLEALLIDIRIIKSHFSSNDDFVLQQSEEELGTMQTQAACQLGFFLKKQHGLEIDQKVLQKLLPVTDELLLTDKTDETIKPVVTGYKEKKFPLREPNEMSSREVADNINKQLLKFEVISEKLGEESLLYNPYARHDKNKVKITYISYQNAHTLSLDEARKYLTFLRSTKEFSRY